MKKLAVLIFFALLSGGLIRANDIYISQSGAGDGSSCGSAKSVSFFNSSGNWGTGSSQIGPDTTVHLCGTITGAAGATGLTVQGSGTSGNPITVLFESGAVMTAPYWGLNGAINVNSKNYIVIDGGANGVIRNTANGSGLAYEAGSNGVYGGGSSNITVKNLNISNICVHANGDTTSCQSSGVASSGIYINGGSNNTVTGNTVHDARWCVFFIYPGGSTTANALVSNNTIYNCDHGVTFGDGGGSAVLNNVTISGNVMHDLVNWDDSNDNFHHNYIHVWAVGGSSAISGLQIYNNYFYGDPGLHNTALINVETQSGNTNNGALIYNNILTNPVASHPSPYGFISSGGTNISLYNNTMVGASTTGGLCFYLGGKSYKISNNVCQNVGAYISLSSNGSVSSSDYNDYYQSQNGFYVNGGFLNFLAWKALCLCDVHSISSDPKLDSAFKPLSASPIVQSASNLSGLGISNLNKDKSGTARPTSGNWDLGALQFGSTTSSAPNPPSALSAVVQ